MNYLYGVSYNKSTGATEVVAIASPQQFHGDGGFLIEFRDGQEPRHVPVFADSEESLTELVMSTISDRTGAESFIDERMIDFKPKSQSRMTI